LARHRPVQRVLWPVLAYADCWPMAYGLCRLIDALRMVVRVLCSNPCPKEHRVIDGEPSGGFCHAICRVLFGHLRFPGLPHGISVRMRKDIEIVSEIRAHSAPPCASLICLQTQGLPRQAAMWNPLQLQENFFAPRRATRYLTRGLLPDRTIHTAAPFCFIFRRIFMVVLTLVCWASWCQLRSYCGMITSHSSCVVGRLVRAASISGHESCWLLRSRHFLTR
jgi:hypothetical protein